jgi:hypothetical protein
VGVCNKGIYWGKPLRFVLMGSFTPKGKPFGYRKGESPELLSCGYGEAYPKDTPYWANTVKLLKKR